MNGIKCGFAQRKITPQNDGIFMDGYGFRLSPSEGVLDDLYTKVAVFKTADGDYFAIVVLDVCGINSYLYEMLLDHIENITGLDRAKIAVCATHTHAGPACNVLAGLPISEDFWSYTGELCGRTILEAMENMCECAFSAAVADTELVSSFNRRGRPMIDKRIRAAVFTDEQGIVRGAIGSASCHPVINTSMLLSADYPSVLTKKAVEEYGVPFLFLQGRGADINPAIDPANGIDACIQQVGNELAQGVFGAVEKAKGNTVSADCISSIYKYVTLPMKDLGSQEELREGMKERMAIYQSREWSDQKHYDLRELEWYRRMLARLQNGESFDLTVPLQVFTLGKRIVFVFIPFELLTSTGNAVEKMLLDKGISTENVFVIGYSNSVNSYLAPLEELPIGGYEVGGCVGGASRWYGLPECSDQTETAVLNNIREMLDELLG